MKMKYRPFKDSDLLAQWVRECLAPVASPKPRSEPTLSTLGNYVVASFAVRNGVVRGLGRDLHEATARAHVLAGRKY
jgi:hypothetical protein